MTRLQWLQEASQRTPKTHRTARVPSIATCAPYSSTSSLNTNQSAVYTGRTVRYRLLLHGQAFRREGYWQMGDSTREPASQRPVPAAALGEHINTMGHTQIYQDGYPKELGRDRITGSHRHHGGEPGATTIGRMDMLEQRHQTASDSIAPLRA